VLGLERAGKELVMKGRRKGGWRAPALIGCSVLLATAALNWTSLSTFYQKAITTFGDLRSVQAALQAKYHTQDVFVQAKRHSAIPGSILSVNFINPPFLEAAATAGSSKRAEALEIATAARDALSPQGEYDHYEILFTRQWSYGVTMSFGDGFFFGASELPPRSR
jgi:hypothetical protein